MNGVGDLPVHDGRQLREVQLYPISSNPSSREDNLRHEQLRFGRG